jgi:glutathione synthase/RimK-type ligase-like ATP-grasp enzyme
VAARALAERGVTVVARPWNDEAATFGDVDGVVLRSNWDYHFTPTHFVEWLDRWESAGVRIWNPPALVRWNLSKQYLLDLARAGVPVVPTEILDGPGEALPALMARHRWTVVVVKPLISASAHDTILVPQDEVAATVRALEAGELRRPVLVQPFIEQIREAGEWSVIVIDGSVTHTVLKRPAPPDFRVQPRLGGTIDVRPAPASVLDAAARVLAALPGRPLYARVDLVETAQGVLVMEVELNEPGLFLQHAPHAADRLADAICRRITE